MGALVVREQLCTGELTLDSYRDVLRSTGRESSVSLFDHLGCDVTTVDPYDRAAMAFDEYVDGIQRES